MEETMLYHFERYDRVIVKPIPYIYVVEET